MKLLRLLRVAPLALMFAGVASAQTTGTIIGVVTDAQSGKPVAGALVVATSPNLQGEQTVVTDKAGAFRLQALPPGDYKLAAQFDGYKTAERSDLNVRLDKTIRANLAIVPEAVQMEEQVVRTGVAPVINVGSAETGAVVSRDFVTNIPVARGVEGLATVAPTAQFDTYGVSFAGASSPENGYLLDGMNVGDAAYGTLGAEILSNFVQEVDVKTGSFMPEYGFSTGGIVSFVSKSGSNEFHGSVFGNLTPGALQADPKAIGRSAEALARQATPEDGTYRADFGAEVGGPIMKDKLWFYVGFAPQLRRTTHERFQQALIADERFDATNVNPGGAACDTFTAADAPNACFDFVDYQVDAEGQPLTTKIANSSRVITSKEDGYQLTGKLTYLINENNSLAVSAFRSPRATSGYIRADGRISGVNGSLSSRLNDQQDDFTDVVARYSSKLLDKRLLVEVTGGYHHQTQADSPVTVDGIDSGKVANVTWTETHDLADFENIGTAGACTSAKTQSPLCQVTNYTTGGSGFIDETKIDRFAGKASVSYLGSLAGSHQVKAGVELQVSTYDHTKGYTGPGNASLGGAVLQEADIVQFAVGSRNTAFLSGSTGGVPNFPNYPIFFQDFRRYGSVADNRLSAADAPGGKLTVKSRSTNNAYYIQDSYSPSFLEGLTVNAGVRWETQDMGVPDLANSQTLKVSDSIGPRLQAIYDWTKSGRSKVAVNWGRFYSAFPLDMADRAFGDERQIRAYREACAAADPAAITDKNQIAGAPESCAVVQGFFRTAARGAYTYSPTGSSSTPVSPDVKSPYVDMYGASIEYEVLPDLSVGFDYTARRTGRVIEDMSNDDGLTYAIANPGEGPSFPALNALGTISQFDPKLAASFDPVTGREFTTPFPKPTREYDGFTFSIRKNFSNKWQAQASYTYSSLRGNYPGFFRPETNQLDPGITSMFDLAGLLANQDGPLPSDTPHQFKAYGSYQFDFGPRFAVIGGAAVRMLSGSPVNYLIAHPDYGSGEGYGLPRGSAGRSPFLTTVDLKGALSYTVKPPYTVRFSVDVFNLLNSQEAGTVDENWTFDSAQPIVNGQCRGRNAASSSNAIAAALADCPDLNFLKTTGGRPVEINTNFAKPLSFQAPLSVRFGLELSF